MSKFKLALNETEKAPIDPIARMKDTIAVTEREIDRGDGPESVPCLSFSTGEGRGTGSEVVPLDELEEYVGVLSHYVEEGIDAVVQEDEGYRPSYEIIQDSIKLVQSEEAADKVSFRSRTGKGAKPQTFEHARFGDVVKILNAVVPQVESLREQFETAKAEEEAKKAAKAAKDAGNGND